MAPNEGTLWEYPCVPALKGHSTLMQAPEHFPSSQQSNKRLRKQASMTRSVISELKAKNSMRVVAAPSG